MKRIGAAILVLAVGTVVHAQGRDGKGRPPFLGRRAVSSYTQTIDAAPDRVFPLLCPIREAEWADGWIGKVVYAASGVAEQDGVYATEHAGEKDDTVWVVTRRDAARRRIEMIYFVPGMRVVKLQMAVRGAGRGRSRVDVAYTNTGLSDAGNAEIARDFENRAVFDRHMAEWLGAMNHYLRTGRILKHAE